MVRRSVGLEGMKRGVRQAMKARKQAMVKSVIGKPFCCGRTPARPWPGRGDARGGGQSWGRLGWPQ